MEQKIKKSLNYSLKDGIFASVNQGIGDYFITPYAIAMGSSVGLIGILASIPGLVGSLLQSYSPHLSERFGSRKAVMTTAVLVHALMWLPIIAIPYVFQLHRVPYLVLFYTALVSIGAVSFPPWSSIMADHVPAEERGKVFGWRNRLFGIINVSSIFGAGFVLYLFKGSGYAGFTIIFAVAFLSRICSWYFLTRMYEPPLIIKDEHRFTLIDFLKRIPKANFGRFVVFAAATNFAVFLASPFFAVYMLRDLGFNYLKYAIVSMASTLTIISLMNAWGRHADHVGNRRVLRVTSIFFPVIPVLWLFSSNIVYLILIQIFSGFFWSGFNLSVSNFIYDAVTPEKRTRCIAYFSVVNGIAIFFGAAIGGYLANTLPPLFGYKLLTLFLISGILRLAGTALCSFVKEVRHVKDVSNLKLIYSVTGLRPIMGGE
ncbi:MAG: MFS transporter [Candidatus Omnitrophota bacterium]